MEQNVAWRSLGDVSTVLFDPQLKVLLSQRHLAGEKETIWEKKRIVLPKKLAGGEWISERRGK